MENHTRNEQGMALVGAILVSTVAVLALLSMGMLAVQQSRQVDQNQLYAEAFMGAESALTSSWADLEAGNKGMIGFDEEFFGNASPSEFPSFDDASVSPERIHSVPRVEYMAFAQDWSNDRIDNNGDSIVDGPEEDSFYTVYARGRSGGVVREVQAIMKKLDLSIWNNAIFGGLGEPFGLISGDAEVHGSVHLLGDNILEGGIAMGPGISIRNGYNGLPEVFQVRLPSLPVRAWGGGPVESLDTTLSVRNGLVHVAAGSMIGTEDVPGNSVKETIDATFVNDGWTGSAVTDDGDRGDPASVFSDNKWDAPYYSSPSMSFPFLNDPYHELLTGETVQNTSTGSLYTHTEFFNEVLSDNSIPGNVVLSTDTDFYFNATTGDTSPPTSLPPADEDYLWYDSAIGILYINGQIEILGDLTIGEDLAAAGHPNNGNGGGNSGNGGAGNGNKVTICHIPPGNPANAHTITVSANAIPAHLAHGDVLEACADTPDPDKTFYYTGRAALLVHGDLTVNANLITGNATVGTEPTSGDPGAVEFGYYNIDMCAGDSLKLSDYVEVEGGLRLGVDFDFVYEDDETWHIEDFNENTSFPLTDGDMDGGNHGDGNYRVSLRMIATGELVDHATVRVNSCRPNESSDPPVAANGAPGLGSGTGDEVVTYVVTPFPENILGVMAEGNVHFSALPGEDTTLVMGAFYAQNDVSIGQGVTVAGTLVGGTVDLAHTAIYQVPQLPSNLPRGMIAAHPVDAFIQLAWTETGVASQGDAL